MDLVAIAENAKSYEQKGFDGIEIWTSPDAWLWVDLVFIPTIAPYFIKNDNGQVNIC